MSSRKSILIALFGFLAFASCVDAQQNIWHTIFPDRSDSSAFSYTVTAHGNIGILLKSNVVIGKPNIYSYLQSTNEGTAWSTITSLPQSNALFHDFQIIDSLNGVAANADGNLFLRTFDNWQTWRADTSIRPESVIGGGGDTLYHSISGVDFSSAAEGIADEGYGDFMTTTDTGEHWKQMEFPGAAFYHSYGNGMFRAFKMPDSLYTTHDNWVTVDTSIFSKDGPLADPSLLLYRLLFGQRDTLLMVGYRRDSTNSDLDIILARSTDAGSHWSELSLPKDATIYPSTISPIDQQTIVIAGIDSLQRIIISTDRGASWKVDTILLDDGRPYYNITSVAVTGSGRVLASIIPDSNYIGSNCLAYLDPASSIVSTPPILSEDFSVFPNPATNEIQVTSSEGAITILDPLGRSYEGHQTGNTLDVSSLPSGVYFISDGHSRAKFVKE